MKPPLTPKSASRHGILFHLIALLTRIQLSTLVKSSRNPDLLVAVFAVVSGAFALGTITAVALITHLPLLFPPLAPSAIILFYTPMSALATPRNVLLSHFLATLSGLATIFLLNALFPAANVKDSSAMNWPQVIAIGFSVASTMILMIRFNCVHPPAGASTLLVTMGYISEPAHIVSLMASVVLLILEAILFNRIIGGLPYPLWRYKPEVAREFATLAGQEVPLNDWQKLTARVLRRH